MRIIFITQEDPFYVKIFFDEFFEHYDALNEIQAVVISRPMGKQSLYALARQMLGFYGPWNFVRMGFRYVAVKGSGRTIARRCKELGIPVIHEDDINGDEFVNRIRSMNIDVAISVASPVIFKKALIEAPLRACINIHNGKLPKYRGMLPNFWQMYHGEQSVGITVHEVAPGIDDGRILLQKDVEILPGETLDSLIKRTKRIGAHVMMEALELIRSDKVIYTENDSSKGSYYSFPSREDVRKFRALGKRLI